MGTVITVKAALPAMLERKEGHIVLVASPLAVLGALGVACTMLALHIALCGPHGELCT